MRRIHVALERIQNRMKGMKGQSNHNLDAKGRLIIPARLRDGLGSSFVLCRGMDKNIYIWNINQDNPFMGYRTSNGTSRMKWFSANPQYIISSYQINNVYTSMWNINVQDIPEYKFTGHKDVVTGFCWDTSNTRLITCAKNGTVLVKKFSEGLRFFDNISTSIVKFSDVRKINF